MITAMVYLPFYVPVLLPIHLSILLPVSLAVLLPVHLPILLPVCLSIRLPVGLAIFLSDIQLGGCRIRQDGRCCHGQDYACDHSGFQKTVLHDAFSFYMREWMIGECCGC